MIVRSYAAGDLDEWVRHLNLARGTPLTPADLRERDAAWPSERFRRRVVGVRSGRIVAIGQLAATDYAPPDHLALTLVVAPPERGGGMGSRMLAALVEIATGEGRAALLADIPETQAETRGWLERRGFVLHARRFESVLDLATFDEAAHAQALAGLRSRGICFATMRDAGEARWRSLFAFFAARLSEAPDMVGLPRWSEIRCRQVLRDHPGSEPDWIIVTRRDCGSVGVSVAHRLGTDGYAFFTGVAPAFRGITLGRTLKGELIRRLRAHGIGCLRTNNLDRNLPALRMNQALGFQPVPGRLELRAKIARAPSVT